MVITREPEPQEMYSVSLDLVHGVPVRYGDLGEQYLYCSGAKFVPFLYRRLGKVVLLALLALREFNNLHRINQVNSSTPAASTIYLFYFQYITDT